MSPLQERDAVNTRRRYAELVRHFLSGRMTNLEYERSCDGLLRDMDEASGQIYDELWKYYCDKREHRMGMAHGMTRDGRRMAARWIMFLISGRPYEYRHMISPNGLIAFITFGLVRRYEYPDNDAGDREYWPYYRKVDFEDDLCHSVLLSGTPNPR